VESTKKSCVGDYQRAFKKLYKLAGVKNRHGHRWRETFAAELKQSTGRAPPNYVLLQRIERAKQQLRDPKRSIIEAGLESGFQNPNHFARRFRKLEGTTPSKFRADYLSRATA
jgi:AraC family transcriptional regulator